MSKAEQMVAGLKSIIKRDLTDDEQDGLMVWAKSHELAHFIEGFPQEWAIFKEMLESYLSDFKSQWDRLMETDPTNAGDLAVQQAQVYGAAKIVRSFIRDVEAAPAAIKDVPDVVRENAGQLRSVPQ